MSEGFVPRSKTMRDPSFGAVVKLDVDSAIIIDQNFLLMENSLNKAVEKNEANENKIKQYVALYGELPSKQNNASEDDPKN